MDALFRWIRRVLAVAVVLTAVAAVVRRRARPGGGGGVVPAVSGDTWPPVPVKDVRPD